MKLLQETAPVAWPPSMHSRHRESTYFKYNSTQERELTIFVQSSRSQLLEIQGAF